MIFHCLRYWVHNYHVDGFRFDLASILSRNRNGELVPNPPVLESIAEDPLLADTKIIAEAWDAAGAYQVGTFGSLRWAEWNGRYRDDVRRFWRGDPSMVGPLATRLAGSSDLYEASGRRPYHSINFITSHDGFTLNDLVSYSEKHNEANGEENRDGEANNFSYNYGAEGPTRRAAVETVRLRQIKNMHGLAVAEPGRADAAFRRRVPPHPTGQQQRLLPGQRNLLVQLEAGREARGPAAVLPGADRLPQGRADGAADRLLPRPAAASRRPAGRELVRPQRRSGRVVGRFAEPGLPAGRGAAGGRAGAAEPSRADADPRGDRRAAFHPAAAGRGLGWRLLLDTAAESPADIYPDLDGPPAPKRGGADGGAVDGGLRRPRRADSRRDVRARRVADAC